MPPMIIKAPRSIQTVLPAYEQATVSNLPSYCYYSTTGSYIANDNLYLVGNNSGGILLFTSSVMVVSTYEMALTGVKQAAFGSTYGLYLKTDGTLWAKGSSTYNAQGPQKVVLTYVTDNVRQVSAGLYHAAFVKTDGTLWVSGGAGGAVTTSFIGIPGVSQVLNWTQVPITNVAQVSCGSHHTFALLENGDAYATGQNTYGQLGFGDVANRQLFTYLTSDVKQVVGGYLTSYIVKTSGALLCCGHNGSGRLGFGTTPNVYTITQATTNVNYVACGNAGCSVLKTDGTIWGTGLYSAAPGSTTVFTDSGLGSDWVALGSGNNFVMALKKDNTIWVKGMNTAGQLGLGDVVSRTTFVQAATR